MRTCLMNELKKLVGEVNDRLLTATKTQLAKVNNVMLIAGCGKARAIYQLLTHRFEAGTSSQPAGFKIDTLCVDLTTAKEIIACYNQER